MYYFVDGPTAISKTVQFSPGCKAWFHEAIPRMHTQFEVSKVIKDLTLG